MLVWVKIIVFLVLSTMLIYSLFWLLWMISFVKSHAHSASTDQVLLHPSPEPICPIYTISLL